MRSNGTQGRWQVGNTELRNRINQGRIRLGRQTHYGFVINYLPDGEYEKILNGEYEVTGYANDGSIIAHRKSREIAELHMPPTQWKIASHNASENGTSLLTSVIGEKRFPFPKSLYAVYDTMRFFVANNPNALIVDFFSGSGTTLHAVNLLNAKDNGQRRCIMVTNNELSDTEATSLKKLGYKPGDNEWENLGIARYVTWPRTVCSIKGVNVNGKSLEGNYGCETEKYVKVEGNVIDPNTDKKLRGTFYKKAKEPAYPELAKIKMSDGFKANAAYFKLGFLDKASVRIGRQFKEMLPTLWMKAGCYGPCPTLDHEKIPEYMILSENHMAILNDSSCYVEFAKKVQDAPTIETVYLVTDSDTDYHNMSKGLNVKQTFQLYRDYLDNFRINSRR